ncbi:MAG TPA: enoyl-CoA hydratase [Acidimicrobiia bacterium]|nr:enoyl-CoA hydratase [Acidimicrobiia bacterium]
MTATAVRVEADGPVARVTLDRPERRNALSLSVMRDLLDALRKIGDDDAIAAVVIAGAGPAFSAGHDLSEMVDRADEFYAELFATCVELMTTVHEIPQPVIARVHGMATAAGCQLVAACDLAVASTDARFATPGVNIGLFCSTPMVPLVRAIGRKRALEMLLTGDPIDAATAADWDLVNRVVAPAELDATVDALAARITRSSATVVGIGKRAFYAQDGLVEADAYGVTAPVMSANAALPDAREGITAFLEKRPPVWPS